MDLENIKQEYFQKGKKEQAIKCAQNKTATKKK